MLKANLALVLPTTYSFLAAVHALKDGAPLEVNVREEHEGKTEVDRDVERPVGFIRRLCFIRIELVLELELGGPGVVCRFCFRALFAGSIGAARDNPDLVCTGEFVYLGFSIDSDFLSLVLSFPERWLEGTDDSDLAIFWKLIDFDLHLNGFHSRPDVRHSLRLALNIYQFHHAGAFRVLDSRGLYLIRDVEFELIYHRAALAFRLIKGWIELERSSVNVATTASVILLSIVAIDGTDASHVVNVILFEEEVSWHAFCLSSQVDLERVFLHIIFLVKEEQLRGTISRTDMYVLLWFRELQLCTRVLIEIDRA